MKYLKYLIYSVRSELSDKVNLAVNLIVTVLVIYFVLQYFGAYYGTMKNNAEVDYYVISAVPDSKISAEELGRLSGIKGFSYAYLSGGSIQNINSENYPIFNSGSYTGDPITELMVEGISFEENNSENAVYLPFGYAKETKKR